jgi:hypothetical protein
LTVSSPLATTHLQSPAPTHKKKEEAARRHKARRWE